MKKRFLAITLALALCVGLAVPAFAAEGKTVTTPDGKFQLTNVVDTAVIKAEGEDAQVMNGETVYLVSATGARLSLVDAEEETNMSYAQYEVHDGTLEHMDAVIGLWEDDYFAKHELSEERLTADEAYFQDGMGDLHSVSILLDNGEDFDVLASILIAFVKEDYEPAPEETDKPDPEETDKPDPDDKPAAPAFTDVEEGAYYEDPVKWAVENEITNGTSTTTFSPGQDCTQAEILTFLYRAKEGDGAASAGDMDKAVSWAREKGMIGESFDPEERCTRSTAVSYIWQAFDSPEAGSGSFTDVDAGADYADAVAWAAENGVTKGDTTTTFAPGRVCSRGEIVTFLYRAYSIGD